MTACRLLVACLTATAAFTLWGCASSPKRTGPPHPAPSPAAPGQPGLAGTPPAPQTVSDAIPRVEPRSPYGNPPFYEVFGRRYYVLSSSSGYVERGVASWYGPGFHKVNTSTHEPYDMYGMTAAHKTLPLPTYVRVTNLQNGRSVVVRVNDRGPFVGNRIVDLSYSAAAKLDMLRDGTAMVEVRAIDPRGRPSEPAPVPAAPVVTAAAVPVAPAATPLPDTPTVTIASLIPVSSAAAATPSAPSPPNPSAAAGAASAAAGAASAPAPASSLFVQAGAFVDPANAERLAAKLRDGGYGTVFVRDALIDGRKMYRVRIGPVPDVPQFDRIVQALEQAGVRDAHLAMD